VEIKYGGVAVDIQEAFEVIKKFIAQEISEFADKEDYNALGCCDEAKQHLAKVEQFVEDACDYSF
jgi:hypothetical protein